MFPDHTTKKKEIRSHYLKIRNALSIQEKEEKSSRIIQHLKELKEFQTAKCLLIYLNYRSEAETIPFVKEQLQRKDKRIFAPKVYGMDLQFREVTSISDVEEGYQGILEPREECPEFFSQKIPISECLMILPGTVFDKNCNRVGYGKGFYDRFMQKCPSMVGIGLGFECQIAPFLPVEEHDYRMNALITETGFYRCDNREEN